MTMSKIQKSLVTMQSPISTNSLPVRSVSGAAKAVVVRFKIDIYDIQAINVMRRAEKSKYYTLYVAL